MNAKDRNNNILQEKEIKYTRNSYGNLKITCKGKLILRYFLQIIISSRFYLGLVSLGLLTIYSIFFIIYVIQVLKNFNLES